MNTKNMTEDLRIRNVRDVITPLQLHQEIPVTPAAIQTIESARQSIHRILQGVDDRLVVVVGPCSIHDPVSAMEYASRLIQKQNELREYLFIVMRVYFEKPRTSVGWKGLINDPDLDESYQINKGLRLSRKLLRDISELGLPAGTEFLDLIIPQYIGDLISWGAIGARTTESQVHRELASGLSCPVGFKNATDGGLNVAIDAVVAASREHNFLSITKSGNAAIFSTVGNQDVHIILRGGKTPNYDLQSVLMANNQLCKAGIQPNVMIDFSHGNSQKQYLKQLDVCRAVVQQIKMEESAVFGVMFESHLKEGRQTISKGKTLNYGQSVTDACLSWVQSIEVLDNLAEAVRIRRQFSYRKEYAAAPEISL